MPDANLGAIALTQRMRSAILSHCTRRICCLFAIRGDHEESIYLLSGWKMIIMGAKGLAKELLAVLQWNGEAGDVFLFDNVNPDTPDMLYGRFAVVKSWEALGEHFSAHSPEFVLGVGGPRARLALCEKAVSLGGTLCSLISKHALIGDFGVKIGDGVCILSHATITIDVEIGEGTLINKAVVMSHDTRVGKYCEVSPGARVLGRATIGDRTEIGTNAVVLPDIAVGKDCRVGAGAVVTRDVPDGSTVMGVPARPVQRITSCQFPAPDGNSAGLHAPR